MAYSPLPGWFIGAAALVILVGAGAPLQAGESACIATLGEGEDAAARVGRLAFRGGIALSSDQPGFGELSDLRVLDDGAGFVAVTDRGFVVTGRLDHAADGTLAAARDLAVRPLPDLGVPPLHMVRRDAEGLAALPDGRWAVSFELEHRIVIYPPGFAGEPERLPLPPGLDRLRLNGGIEALAALPDGGLVAIAEAGDEEGRHRAWRWRAGAWDPFTYRAEPPFQPTGLAVLPDGDLLVLERRASWFGGLGARVVRVPLAAVAAGATVSGRELGRLGPPLIMENFEGIDARRTPEGRTVVYLLSDDNEEPLFRTVMLMFELVPD